LLGAYLTYQLGHAFHLAPWLAAGLIVPAFFALGVVLHVVFARFRVTEFTSLLVTFGLAVLLESLIQWFWTADYRRYEPPVAGAFIALISTLAPAQIWAWLGTVFAVVIIGGLGNPVGALLAGFLIGVSESVTMAVAAPAWAPLVSFSILIGLLVLRPERV